MLRPILLGVSAATAAGLLFVNVYNSLVDAPNWGSDIPHSFETARAYYAVANPGSFFRVFSPFNQVLALIAVIISWKNYRYIAMAALAFAILADVMTFGYFYPRNEIMFISPVDHTIIANAWQEWSSMNWVRTGICFVNTVASFTLLIVTSKRSAS